LSLENGQEVIIFNAYGFLSKNRLENFNHYCLGFNIGTAFINDEINGMPIFNRIAEYRKKFPNAMMVLSPHWSTDFNKDTRILRNIAKRAIASGIDIILGHGPHIPIGLEEIFGKPVIYSLGDFVFNTTGLDLEKSGGKPYGIVSKLNFENGKKILRLYPIYVHRINTFFRPRPVNLEEFEDFVDEFMGADKFEKGKCDLGRFLQLDIT